MVENIRTPKFKKFGYEHGTTQHNGIGERMNRTLTRRAKTIHIQLDLPK